MNGAAHLDRFRVPTGAGSLELAQLELLSWVEETPGVLNVRVAEDRAGAWVVRALYDVGCRGVGGVGSRRMQALEGEGSSGTH